MPAITYSAPLSFPSDTYPGGDTWYEIGGSGPFYVMTNGFSVMTQSALVKTASLTLMGHSVLTVTNSSIANFVSGNAIDCYGDLDATVGAGSSVKGQAGVQSYLTLKLNNAGLIEGAVAGVQAAQGEIINSGTIKSGQGGTAVKVDTTADHNAYLLNSGTILNNSGYAVRFGDGHDTLINSGLIEGGVELGGGYNKVTNNGSINGSLVLGDYYDSVYNTGSMRDVYLGGGNDTYEGAANSSARVSGGAGDDYFLTKNGLEEFDGGEGDDSYNLGKLSNVVDVVKERANEGFDTIISTISRNLSDFVNVEGIRLWGNARVNATGSAGANVLDGSANENVNVLRGLAGSDTYYVGLEDIVDEAATGSSGTDTIFFDHYGPGTSYSLGGANVKGSVENLTYQASNVTTTGTLTGNALNNVIKVIQSNGFATMTLRGLAGNDTYIVDDRQVVDESAAGSNGIDRVQVNRAYSLSDTTKVKGDVEQIEWVGATTPDTIATLTGNGLANMLIADGGAKITLRGLAGADTYVVGSRTIVDESASGSDGKDTIVSAYTVDLGNTARVKGTVENVTLTGTRVIDAIGTSKANVLTGNTKSNILDGKGGADVFIFNTAYSSSNVDTLKGFVSGQDKIHLDDAFFKALGSSVTSGEIWKGDGVVAAHDLDDRLIYNTTNGALYYDPDGNTVGGDAAVQIAVLFDKPSLSAGDFVIV